MNESRHTRRRHPVLMLFLIVLSGITVGICGLALLSWTSVRPDNRGVRNGRLAACPDHPNCVSTQAEDREHWIAPLTASVDAGPSIAILAEIVRGLPRTSVVEQTGDYLYAEFRSPIFRFCDDVEFFAEPETHRVHFRSASRVGRSDLGVNRARMELIRHRFDEAARANRKQATRRL